MRRLCEEEETPRVDAQRSQLQHFGDESVDQQSDTGTAGGVADTEGAAADAILHTSGARNMVEDDDEEKERSATQGQSGVGPGMTTRRRALSQATGGNPDGNGD